MNKLFDPHTNLGVFVIVLVTIAVVIFMLFVAPEWLASLSAIVLPIAMTTGKHDFPPMKKGDIIITVIVTVVVLIFGAVTRTK